MSPAPRGGVGRWTLALALLLLVAAAQRLWNTWAVPPLTGYDSPGHAGYMLTILVEGRLPHPYEGWSTFHPPLYYMLGAGVWGLLDSAGPRAVLAGVRALGAFAGLAAGFVAYRIVRGLGYSEALAWVGAALVLFVPAAQLAGAMIGNEAVAAGVVALSLPFVLRLALEPGNLRAAAGAGVFAGLAVALKFTGALAVVACAVPFARVLLQRRASNREVWRAAALCFGLVFVIAAPTYVRNLALVGSPVPLTRDREPMRSAEAGLVLAPRRVVDFLWVPPNCILRPSLYHVPGRDGSFRNRNNSMQSVWGLSYASAWYDPFGHRTSVRDHRDGVWFGPMLAILGLAPTLAMLAGFGAAVAALVRRRGATPDAPLAVMALAGLALYVWLTATAASAAAAKASYLLGLGVPAAVFFARGASLLPPRARLGLLGVSTAAAAVAGLVFTTGVLYPSQLMGLRVWRIFAAQLPNSYILEAIQYLNQ